MTNAIANAVAPLKQASVDAAVARTIASQNAIIEKLSQHGWDIDAAFPRPSTKVSRSVYQAAYDLRCAVEAIVDFEKSVYRHNEVKIVKVNADKIAYELEQAALNAKYSFDCYVTKLNVKVGTGIIDATMGYVNGLWSNSNLIVQKNNGAKEVWNTKCITNRSKLGRWFNQFPTRQVKI
jgi:hypothetical protein